MATAQPVATVVAVTGTAYARDAEGRMRLLRAGDAINEGETVVTSSGGRVELAFEDGSVLPVEQNQSIAVTAELSETSRPQALDAQLGDASIAQVIQALNDGGNLDDALEAPAAGLAGGAGGEGNNFVRLLRITEGVDPLAFDFAPTEPDRIDERLPGAPEADDGTPATTTPTPPSTVPAVTVDLELGADGTAPTLTGTYTDASSVTVTITGSDGSTQTVTATLNPDGSWSVDTSTLSFTEEVTYTATATATDNSNNTATATDTDSFDLQPTVTVDLELGADGSSPTLTGTSTNATSVEVTITGTDGSTQTATATLNPDGSWSVDTSTLTFNEEVTYTATATATDNANNSATAIDSDSFDLQPTVTVDLELGADGSSPTLTGTSTNATSVEVTITGTDGSTQTATATLNPDGTWSVDTSTLTFNEEVTYTATATAKDNANNSAVDTDSDSFDLKPTVTVDLELGADGTSPTLTGTSTNATSVEVTITGTDGSTQTATATLNPDGSWSVDTSTLTFNEEVTYTATATAKDNANNSAVDTDSDSFDLKPTVTVDLELGADGSSPTLTGTSTNATSVEVTITGTDGSTQTATATLNPDGSWTANISGLTFNEAVTYTATAIAKDNVNNTATAIDSDSFDLPPAADGGAVSGVEDSSHVFQWSDFKVSDGAAPASSLGIVINSLPVNGKLEYLNAAGDWVAVSQGQEVSQADIAAGHLRFTPAANESGSDAYGGTGVGDQQGDYARFEYSPTDGAQVGDPATMVVDITPVADAPTLSVTVGAAQEITLTPAGSFSGTLNASNLLTTSGVSVSAKNFVHNPDGTYSLSSASSSNLYLENSSTTGKIGVAGNHPGASSQEAATGNQIGYSYTTDESEELIFTFQNTVTTATANISNLWIKDNGKNATEVGVYELYRDGVLVGTATFNGTSSGNRTVTMTANDGLGFDTVVFKAASSYLNMTTAQSIATGDGSDYYVTGLTYQGTTAAVKAYTYALDIDAALVDTDGSETLSGVSISGIPSGAVLSDGTHTYTSTDSSHSLLLDGWNLDSLVITTPAGSTTDFTLQVSVSSSEHANGDTATTTTAVTVVVGAADAVAPAVHLTGSTGDDHITGGSGDDVIAGGAGSDILAGGLGADTFIWSFGDQGAEGKPEVDRVLDFDTSSDKLDLHDLLQGESASGGNLGSFLFVEHQGSDTVIHVSTQGGFTSGYDAGKEDQTIVLQGVDLVGGVSSQAQILQNLVDHGKLITD